MKRIKKLLVFLVVVLSFAMLSPQVFATTVTKDDVSVTLTTDKKDYTAEEPIAVTLKLTNNTNEAIKHVLLENVIPEGYTLSQNYSSTKQIDVLAPDKTVTLKNLYVVPVSISFFNSSLFYVLILAVVLLVAFLVIFAYKKKLQPKGVLSVLIAFVMLAGGLPQTLLSAEAAENKLESVSHTIKIDGKKQVLKANATYNGNLLVSAYEYIDTDDDGLADYLEDYANTDKENYDTDGDGLSDYIELFVTKTDPNKKDSDSNGIPDGKEDADGDGLSNEEEIEYKTGINDKDSDGDMLSDNEEINQYKTDPLKIDTDGDSLSDGEEVILGLNPLRKKTDGKTLDSKRLFKQSLSASRIESKLIKKSSPAIPSLTGKVSGLIDKHISIVSVDVYALKDNTAVVGVPVYVKSDYSKNFKFKLKFDCSNSGYDAKVLTISKYDNGKIEHCKTKQADGILSATVTEGIYYVTNMNIQLENLGIDIADGLKGKALKKYNKSKSIASVGEGSDITNGSADIAFVVDTTGSMDKILNVVTKNLDSLVDSLGGNAVNKRFAILKFKDAEFNERPELIKNGESNWFTTQDSIKEAFKTIKVGGGVDAGETVIDSLQKAQSLDFRGSANKRIILITDSYYKGTAESMHSLAENLADSGITVSVITDKNYESDYEDLAKTTLGKVTTITAEDYRDTFENIDEKPAGDVEEPESTSPTQSTTPSQQPSESTQPTTPGASEPVQPKEYWVVLSDYQCVKLNGPVSILSIVDTDGDGVSDYEELGERTTVVLRDYIKDILEANGLPESEYAGKTSIYVYNYKSNPVLPDTDFDGIGDYDDKAPMDNYFTGKLATEYAKTSGGNSVEFNMDYRWFFEDSTKYNNYLSKMSLLYSSAVYHENSLKVVDSKNLTVTYGTKIKDLMSSFGLKDAHNYYLGPKYSITDLTERNMYDEPLSGYTPVNDEHMSEVALGHRTVTYGGKTKTILAVTVRGTNGTLSEWQSNFDVGDYYSYNADWKDKNHHKGFDIAANRITRIIDAYCKAYNVDTSNLCYWITGHSRGAGISNLLGAYYADQGAETFTYTFAAPAALRDQYKTNAKQAKYNSIFNVVNKDDFVPCLPMEKWFYTLYGKTSKVSIGENSAYESQWEKMSGIFDYNPPSQKTLSGVCDALAGILINENANSYNRANSVDARYACYNMSCIHSTHSNDLLSSNGWAYKGYGDGSWDKITITNRGVSADSRAGALDKIPKNARPYCGINYTEKFLAPYTFENCETPAYFMQILAAMMGGAISSYRFAVELDIADRYESAKTQIVYGAIAGITHPHYTESYYVLADNITEKSFS